jgi:hypothetical protein
MTRPLIGAALLLLTVILTACGSGGGGDDFDPLKGAAVSMSVEPNSIGVGDRLGVRIFISRVNPDGVVVVLRYTTRSLHFIAGTSFFRSDGDRVLISPTFGPGAKPEYTFITFYLPASAFGDSRTGEIQLELLGERQDNKARVELDEFKHNILIPPEREFSLADPNFSADDAEDVRISR